MRLSTLRIAEPCPEDWSAMTGDARERHCARCATTVTNLAELTRVDAEALLARSSSEHRVCVRATYDDAGGIVTRSTQEARFLGALRALAARRGEGT